MSIDLSAYETGKKLVGNYDKQLLQLQEQLARLQSLHIAGNARTLTIFEGWDASGKGDAIKRITACLDPRYFRAYPVAAPTTEENDKHFLWRFWSKLPGPKQIHIWDGSHYGRVLRDRVDGACSEAEWRRGFDEINEFESQQVDIGTGLIKIFLHVTTETQDKILRTQMDDPSKQWKVTKETFRNRGNRAEYVSALTEMFQFTDTRWAPWHVIDGNNVKAAQIAVLDHVVSKLEQGLPKEYPKIDPSVAALAKKALGKKG